MSGASLAGLSEERRIDLGLAAKCPVCERVIRVVNPRGGDGSARKFVKHGPAETRCENSGMFAPGWGG